MREEDRPCDYSVCGLVFWLWARRNEAADKEEEENGEGAATITCPRCDHLSGSRPGFSLGKKREVWAGPRETLRKRKEGEKE